MISGAVYRGIAAYSSSEYNRIQMPFCIRPATAFALFGAAAGNWLDWQTCCLTAGIVLQYPGESGVNNILNAGNGERCFGDVGGHNYFLLLNFIEHKSLLVSGKAGIQR